MDADLGSREQMSSSVVFMYVQVRGGRCAKRSLVCLERAMARKPANMTRVHICDGGGPTRGEAGRLAVRLLVWCKPRVRTAGCESVNKAFISGI